ncbi:hypothetical protein ACYSNU_10845 [Enterococcus sp. LJL120]
MKNNLGYYLKFKRATRKKDLSATILMLLPFLLIIGLFFVNQTLAQREQAAISARNQMISENAQEFLDRDTSQDDYDYSEQYYQAWFESGQNDLERIEVYEHGTFLERLKRENQELDTFYNVPLQEWDYPEEEVETYGFYVKPFVDGKRLVNNYLIDQQIADDSIRYGTNTATFLISLSVYLTGIGGLCYFMLCFGFNQLKQNENDKYRFLAVQPLQRRTIFLADFLEFLGRSVGYLLLLIVFAYSLAWLFGEASSWDYPVLTTVSGQMSSLTILPVWHYLVIVFGMFLVNLCGFYFITLLIFLLIRKSFVSIFFSLAIFAYFFVLSQVSWPTNLQEAISYSPTTYVTPSAILIGQSNEEQQLISGSGSRGNPEDDTFSLFSFLFTAENGGYYTVANLARKTGNGQISWQRGCLSSGIFTGLMAVISSWLFKKKMCS